MAKGESVHITNPKAVRLICEQAELENRSQANCAANAIINYYKTSRSQPGKSIGKIGSRQ